MTYRQLNKALKGMNTKKAIFFWWKQLGNITNRIDDLKSFYKCIDNSILIDEVFISDKRKQIFMGKKTWKYTLLLYFINGECTRIVNY